MKHLEIAFSYFGEKEIVGGKHNPKIVQMFKDVGHSWVQDDETAWCAAFVGSCLKNAGLHHTGKLNARSYLDLGEKVDKPKIGDIVVFWRGTKDGWQGHVGFYIKEDEDGIFVLGGNQNNQVCIAEYPKYQLLGYRRIVTQEKGIKDFTTQELFTELFDRIKGLK